MKLADLYVEIRANTTGFFARLKTIQAKLAGVSQSMDKLGRIAKKVFMVTAAVLTGAAVAAIKFQKQLAIVSTMLSGPAKQRLTEYSRALMDMAAQFGQSTATLSKGLYDILSASVDASKALEVLKVSARAAAGGFTETGITADAITTILNAYQISADKAAEISDKLFATVKRGKLTMGELSAGIGKAAATAAIAGMSLDELLAAISTITRAGIRTDQAMTAVVGVLRAFIGPTSEAKAVAKQYGVELSTATLRAEGLSGVIQKLNGLTAEQLRQIFPNIRGLKGIAAAMQDLEGHAIDLNMVTNSAGMTWEAYQKRVGTASFQIDRMKEKIKNLFRSMGQNLLPTIKDGASWLGKFTSALSNSSGVVLETIKGIAALAIKLIMVVGAVKPLSASFMLLATNPLVLLIAAVGAVGAAMVDWSFITTGLKKTLDEFIKANENINDILKTQTENFRLQQAETRGAARELAELRGKEERTANEQQRMVDLTDMLTKKFPTLTDAIADLGTSFEATTKAMKAFDRAQVKGTETNLAKQIEFLQSELWQAQDNTNLAEKRVIKLEKTKPGITEQVVSLGIAGGIWRKQFEKAFAELDTWGERAIKLESALERLKKTLSKTKEENRTKAVLETEVTSPIKGKLPPGIAGLVPGFEVPTDTATFEKALNSLRSVQIATMEDVNKREMAMLEEQYRRRIDIAKDEVRTRLVVEKEYQLKKQELEGKHEKRRVQELNRQAKEVARGQIAGLNKRQSFLQRITSGLAGFMTPEEQLMRQQRQRERQANEMFGVFGGETPEEKAVKELGRMELEQQRVSRAGQYQSITSLWKQISAAGVKPASIPAKSLKVLESMDAQLLKLNEHMEDLQVFVAAE